MLSFRKFQTLQFTSALAFAALTCGAAPNPGVGRWMPSANLSAARAGSCSAVLADGSVLVTGGSGVNGALASAEMLGARRGSNGGSMLTAREDHICATLNTGAVLVAGGRTTGGGITNSAELFDPQTRSWSAAGSLGTARSGAVSLLLKDGRVLIAGGMSSGAPTSTIEIFNPVTRQFSAASVTMSARRTGHAAATLRDGRVVLAGGFDGANVLDSIDIFDPHTGSLTPGGRLATPRRGLSATALLDGDVLFAGGNDGSKDLASAQLFHGSTGTPGEEISMAGARANHIAIALPHNNTVLLLGGTAAGEALLNTEVYVPWRHRFEPGSGLGLGRAGATANVLKTPGRLVVIGGRNRDGLLASSEETAFATLTSDKDDYLPGETVVLTGTGWLPGETVQMNMTVDPKTHEDVTLISVADADGNFTNSDYLVQKSDLGVRFYVTSEGSTSGRTAAVLTFTDGISGTVELRDSTCTTKLTSIPYGASACIWANLTISGAGDFRMQWYSGTTISQAALDLGRDHAVTGGVTGIFTDVWSPPYGTWTVLVCKTGNAGNCAGGNQLPGAGFTLGITPKVITVNAGSITANNKVYDGNTTATLNTAGATLSGVVSPDQVTLNTAGATGTFNNKNAANGKPVTVTGLTLGGADAAKYTLTQPTPTADITPKALTVTGITATKVYDGTTTASFNTSGASLVGVVAPDVVSLDASGATGTFASKDAGNPISVTSSGLGLTGANGNYTLTQPTIATGSITPKALTVAGITANNKPYDGNTSATLGGSGSLVGVLNPDAISLTGTATGTFSDKNVGNGKTVTISGLSLGSNTLGNYSLTQPTTTANITAAGLTITGVTAANKVYDRGTSDTLNTSSAALLGVVGSEDVHLTTGSALGAFNDKNVANNKPVTASGFGLSGTATGNYTLSQPTGLTANITPLALTLNGTIAAQNKTYNGDALDPLSLSGLSISGVLPGDIVALDTSSAIGHFPDKNIGTNRPVSLTGIVLTGLDSGNYSLPLPSGLTASIFAAGLTVNGITANNKVYDATTAATLNTVGATLVGVVGTENVTLTGSASGTFGDANVGTGKSVTVTGLTLGGTDKGNYTLTPPTPTAIINSILTVGPRSQLVALTWKAYPGATGYQVCRSDPPGTSTPTTNCAATTTLGYSFGSLNNCSTYNFQVTPQFPGTIPGAATPIMSAMPKALLTTCP